MAEFDMYHQFSDEIERQLRLRTYPLAVKLIEKEQDIPEGAQRPLRDHGYHLSLCQAFSRSRLIGSHMYGRATEGMAPRSPTIAMLKEDMWCPEPVIGYGLAQPPDYFLEGHTRYPGTRRTLAFGKAWAQAFPRLEVGRCIGVMSAPLMETNFSPDVIVIYCDSAQVSLLISAAHWKDGQVDFPARLSPSAACVRSVVPAILDGDFTLSLPCWGDRTRALAHDSELIFTVPVGKLEDLKEGLRAYARTGRKMPVQADVWPDHEMPRSYVEVARLMGMRV